MNALTGSMSSTQLLNEKTPESASDTAIRYINENLVQPGTEATFVSVDEAGGLYNVTVSYQGNNIPVYVTRDGSYVFLSPPIDTSVKMPSENSDTPVPSTQTPSDIQKSSKPNVELFVMSHCPYGTQIEKGILPVVKELSDKIDFEVKFVNYAMHGKKELDEQLRQYCIQRDYNDKYIQYLSAFLEDDDFEGALETVGLTEANINGCVKETDELYKVTELFEDPQKTGWSGNFPPFNVYDKENKEYGVRGSPTLVINGKQASSARDAQSLLNTICGAFTSKPEECNTDMTSFGNPAPGFGFDTQGGSATAAGCGA
ncbi:MAG: hypothetical protein KKF65_05855 [Nanoarchaeota archaeon]|nr:hypothetical protein [Nanoarchaeota archaeon]